MSQVLRHVVWTFALFLMLISEKSHGEETGAYEVQEWSVWFSDPTFDHANARTAYSNALPSIVRSIRTEETSADHNKKPVVFESRLKGQFSPISVMTFHGEPISELDVEVSIESGRFLAHWPPAKSASRRIRWLGAELSSDPSERALPAYVSPSHWFRVAREKGQALYLTSGTRCERFLAYDVELNFPVLIEIEGGPGRYGIKNLSNRPLHDLMISAPTPEGRRIGWLDRLEPTGPKEKEDSSAPAKAQIVLSSPLPSDAETWQSQTVLALKERLLRTGMEEKSVDLLLSLYAQTLFESEEMVALYRISPAALEEIAALDLYPQPRKITRLCLVIVCNFDPGLHEEVEELIAGLGNPEYNSREAAERRLQEVGRLAVPALKKALGHQDPEIVFRAERILLSLNESIDEKSSESKSATKAKKQ